jgi:hypothetical protein
VRLLEREARGEGDASRILDLVHASITDELLAVRARIEGWPC